MLCTSKTRSKCWPAASYVSKKRSQMFPWCLPWQAPNRGESGFPSLTYHRCQTLPTPAQQSCASHWSSSATACYLEALRTSQFVIWHDSKNSWLDGYTVSVPSQRGQVKLGAADVYAAQPHYDHNNKGLTVAVKVKVLSSADDAPTHDLPAWLGKCHTSFCEKWFDEVYSPGTGKLSLSRIAGKKQFAYKSTSAVYVAEVHKHCTDPHLLSITAMCHAFSMLPGQRRNVSMKGFVLQTDQHHRICH